MTIWFLAILGLSLVMIGAAVIDMARSVRRARRGWYRR